jgi:hypothetical protein
VGVLRLTGVGCTAATWGHSWAVGHGVDVLMSQLVAFAAEPPGHDVDDQDEDDVRSRGAAIVSCLRAKDTVIVHDGTVWELTTR